MQSFMIRISILVGLLLVAPTPVVGESCRLCAPEPERLSQGGRPSVPLRIEIETALDLGRVAQGAGGGAVELDPKTGTRRVAGALADLGGMALTGTAMVTGTPFARVRLQSTTGDIAEVVQMQSNLPPAPTLNEHGQLRFTFGGKMVLKGGESGAFRGSVPISVEYE